MVRRQLLSKLLSDGLRTARRPPIVDGLPIWSLSVPPRGFEPLISALKGRRPGPLDDGGREPVARRAGGAEEVYQEERARSLDLALIGSGSWIRTNDLRVMSPTSYHCSIPRRTRQYTRARSGESSARPWRRPIFPSRCQPSIVGAGAFHFRVRDGNGWVHSALATKATHFTQGTRPQAHRLPSPHPRLSGRYATGTPSRRRRGSAHSRGA